MIRVLVVEDSLVQRTLLVGLLKADPEISVVGAVTSGAEALAFLARDKPDVVTMDLRMPDMNGLEVTRQIMETTPLPVVIVSEYWDAESADLTFRAMEAGAVAGVSKPSVGRPESEEVARQLIQTVKLMSEVKVIRRWPRSRRADNLSLVSPPSSSSRISPTSALVVTPPPPPPQPKDISLVAIGASTGGPPVLRTILAALPRTFPVPILIVQHIARGFTSSLVQWLKTEASPLVQVAKQGEEMLPGHIYIAPDDFQMGVALNKRIALALDPVEHSLRPSVSYLFRSLVSVYGGNVIAVLLTGMGRDGAQELRLLRDQGAITIAQNKETSVVHGMPGVAIALDAATHIMAPEEIAPLLVSLTQPSSSRGGPATGGPATGGF
ncbi:MAG: chemotaxis-specific protein-glutamate methyltransferase CheB [Deltaproteobacteria bacterium]|nr:chemotaxis-specific protein-glutamate methyltransferase CheB [Deltaproteobacteria bacterium]